jgi:hypothetical protein
MPIKVFFFIILASTQFHATAQDWDLFAGVKLQTSWGLYGADPSLGRDLNGHLGLGTGLFLGAQVSNMNSVRLTFDFTGTQVATWYYTFPNQADRIEYQDIWREMRLGLEHAITLGKRKRYSMFYGAGIQESWVNRTEGSLLEVTLLALAWSEGATSGSARYSTKSTALDRFSAYANVGAGWRFSDRCSLELRYLVAPYQRYQQRGLRTMETGSVETRLGHRLVLSVAGTWGR